MLQVKIRSCDYFMQINIQVKITDNEALFLDFHFFLPQLYNTDIAAL